MGVLSSHLCGVWAYALLRGVSENLLGVCSKFALEGVRSVSFLGSELRSCLTMGVVSHLVRLGVLYGCVWLVLFWSIYKR
jgi:hypothetical protein